MLLSLQGTLPARLVQRLCHHPHHSLYVLLYSGDHRVVRISLAKVHQEESGGLFHRLDHNLDFRGKGRVGELERVEVQKGV
jgi:hypothetical protein